MSRNQWIVTAVLGLAVVLVFGCFVAYWLMYLMGGLPALMLGPFQVIGAPTEPAAETPTVLISPTPSVKQTPTSLPTTAKPEPPTPTNTRVISLTTRRLRSTLIPTEAFSPDNWEPDNTPADASLVAPGDMQTHNLHVEGDQDWLYFQAVADTTYVIETSNLGMTWIESLNSMMPTGLC